eukprot:Hpha_TRINITY_DN16436_c0_g7::TRINITY_DN16436_c0_g7_i1::g.164102::m.164102
MAASTDTELERVRAENLRLRKENVRLRDEFNRLAEDNKEYRVFLGEPTVKELETKTGASLRPDQTKCQIPQLPKPTGGRKIMEAKPAPPAADQDAGTPAIEAPPPAPATAVKMKAPPPPGNTQMKVPPPAGEAVKREGGGEEGAPEAKQAKVEEKKAAEHDGQEA